MPLWQLKVYMAQQMTYFILNNQMKVEIKLLFLILYEIERKENFNL